MLKRPLDLMALGLLTAGVLLAFKDPLLAMENQWSASPMYSHAYVVPLISAYLVWARRDALRAHAPAPARLAALPVLALAVGMLVVGGVAAVQIVQQLGFVLTIAGLVLYLFGPAWLKVSTPAIAYLLFMVPIWDVFTEPLHDPFQHNSAQLGIALMRAVGVPAWREGTVIALPNIVIEVARACSGVNYLVAVLAMALPLAFLRLRSAWRRVLLIVSATIISALANGVRVALIGVLAYLEIGSPLHGPFHLLHGLFVAGVGYVALFAGLHLLETQESAREVGRVLSDPPPRPWHRWPARDAYGLALGFWVLVFVGVAPVSVPQALAKPLDGLPTRLGEWHALPAFQDAPSRTDAWADADERLFREYRGSHGELAAIDIYYFSAQQQNREVVNFRAAGLHRVSQPRHVTLPDGSRLTVNLLERPDQGEIGLFWYELDGAPEARELAAKLRSVWSVLTSRRSNAAAIMVTSRPGDGDRRVLTDALVGLATDVHVAFASHWPSVDGGAP